MDDSFLGTLYNDELVLLLDQSDVALFMGR